MATKAQIAANRENAKKSCGPTSPEGKAKSSINAISHGFAASVKFIDGEDPEEFYGLQADLVHEFQPATHMEQILVEKMVLNHWLSLRAVRLQSDALRFRMEPNTGETPKDLGLLIRYQTAADRAFHRAHSELLKAQKERKNSEIGFVSKSSETVPPPAPQPEPKSIIERYMEEELRNTEAFTSNMEAFTSKIEAFTSNNEAFTNEMLHRNAVPAGL